ncbi:dithiol-disulfide isomerase [Humibacillus sp. DSM 29435]|uniref:DsbA family oxidoreductase n=1 Tax=Humibacillus sp. DSM 29435 TaxID=1869167 RepID=UPI0008721B17|nr:DsbA family oxidoreductase [Humibacillus sp. DSM 29435]OFE15327.1 dithiol-disulfide isomerase [Humibacillus sp. DSM 29435]
MKIDIWTDIVCPFCYLGRGYLETAIAGFEHRDEVELTWHSFELDRNAEAVSQQGLIDMVATKYGASREQTVAQHESMATAAREIGLEFNWEAARPGNTFDAHRLVHLAAERGLDGAAHERLMQAYFAEGRPIGDRETLADLAAEIGLDRDEVVAMLESDDYGNHVRSDQATATMLGITGVPFFVFDRKYGVSGAQPVDVLTQALETAWSTRHERPEPVAASAGCGGGCGSNGCGGACSS